jgi:hypothetical protein
MTTAKKVESWSDVPDSVIEAFTEAVEQLQKTMVPCSYEGDSAVRVIIVDRRNFESFHFDPIPYDSWVKELKKDSPEYIQNEEDRLDILKFNASIANDDLKRALDSMRRDIMKKREKKKVTA